MVRFRSVAEPEKLTKQDRSSECSVFFSYLLMLSRFSQMHKTITYSHHVLKEMLKERTDFSGSVSSRRNEIL
uniref:Ovule protein n=1 Tax=Caenorhabditis tropicalis TaxID=1561998 RepID=A0A1I7UZ29_9PELO